MLNKIDRPLVFTLGAIVAIFIAMIFLSPWPSGAGKPDWWMVRFTGGAVLVGLAQFVMFLAQLKLMRRNVEDAAAAAKAATEQARIAQSTFANLERPYIFVFGVSPIHVLSHDAQTPIIEYDVANYGKVAAVIEGVWIEASPVKSAKPSPPTLEELDNILFTHPILAPNECRERLSYAIPTGIQLDGLSSLGRAPRLEDDEEFFMQVIVAYRGPFTSGHITAACWRYDGLTNGFAAFRDTAHTFMR